MIRLSPRLLLAAASGFVGTTVDIVDPDGCTLLHRWGYWSHFDHLSKRSSWPFDEALSADDLAKAAEARRLLTADPGPGDLFLQYSPTQRIFIRGGVIVHVRARGCLDDRTHYFDLLTIEAATDASGSLGGKRGMRVRRRLVPSYGDRFVRWAEYDRYASIGGIAVVADRVAARVPAMARAS